MIADFCFLWSILGEPFPQKKGKRALLLGDLVVDAAFDMDTVLRFGWFLKESNMKPWRGPSIFRNHRIAVGLAWSSEAGHCVRFSFRKGGGGVHLPGTAKEATLFNLAWTTV